MPEIEFQCVSTLQYDCVMDAITAASDYMGDDGRTIVSIVKNVKLSAPPKQWHITQCDVIGFGKSSFGR
jgi:hypothetical protein